MTPLCDQSSEADPGIRVTVEDLATGQSESAVIRDDYIVIAAGSCYVSNTQLYPKSGTHQLTIKGRKEHA